MISTQQLPACHRHIKGGQAADTLYTLAKYAAPNHLESTDAREFHSLLCAANIITVEHPLPKKQDAVTCFQAISQYHCGHLCPMCSYSARNKNRLEAEESILLSYALKDFTSFQFLKKSGLTAEHFQALFLLNDAPSGKIVSTLPLFRLAYSYIDHAGNEALAFKDLPAMIANALNQNNRGKLLPQNVQNIRTYLERLQTQCRSVTNEKIEKPLSSVLHPETKTEPSASQNSKKEDVPEPPPEAYRVLSEAKGEKGLKKPSEMLKELVSKINTYDYSPYIFSMLQYVRMYEVLSAHPLLSQKEHAQRLRVLSSVEMFLGISYKLEEIADTQKPLFDLSEKLECQFHYTNDLKLKEGIYSVTFTFSHEKPVQSLVTDILYRISRKNLAHIYGYRLLRFAKDSFTIATTAEYYGQLCEIVANISTYLAERQDLVPLIVKEDTIK